jgi:hypothetical protein|tara:strand:+ start:2665 stop:3261 length:597 start_codon:yes stop_codon:yes gene_type:complete
MTQPRLEIVTYQVGSPKDAHDQRQRARERASEFPGFSGWLPLADGETGERRADLVVWADQAAAKAAAGEVKSGDDFAPFRETISALGAMGHFALPAGGLPMMQDGEGMELGRFRLRPDVTQTMLRIAHDRMVERHLSRQIGWRGQRLARLEDGSWLDLAFASTPDHARAICASWAGNADCEAFLDLIEPVGMEFGRVG